MLRSLAILGIAALLALVLLPADMPVPVFAAVVLLYGASALAWGVLYQTLATELAGPNIQGLGSGVATTLVQAGSSVIPFVFGLLVSATGSYTPSWILLMLLLAGAAVLLGSGFNRADTADEEVPNPYMPPRRGTRDTSLYNLILPYRL